MTARRERDGEPAERGDESAPAAPSPAAVPGLDPANPAAVARLSALAGNRAVARAILARHGDHDGDHDHDHGSAPEAGGTATTSPPATVTQADQEAKAAETWQLLARVHRAMLASPDAAARNTGQMIDTPQATDRRRRFQMMPMTLRSDSDELVTRRRENARESAYYFYGSAQDNEHRHGPRTIGTVTGGDTVLIRGHSPGSGALRGQDDLIATLVHEVSHQLVAGYGEHADTLRDSASFDRYRDEFRAYWVEPRGMGDFGHLTDPDARADAIRTQLVGTSATEGGYPDLRAQYWREPHDTNRFRQQVDGHRRPDGFNLANSPRLDRLVTLMRDHVEGRGGVEDVIWQLAVIPAAERAEAAGATLIDGLVRRMSPESATRVRRALTDPASVNYGREINPRESPRITAVLDAVAAGEADQIKAAYQRCEAAERADMQFNAHLLVWVDHAVPDPLRRAALAAMFSGLSALMFDAARDFMAACEAAAADRALTEPPEPMRAALRRMTFTARLGFFRFGEEAVRLKVDTLPGPVRAYARGVLRGERDP